MRIGRAATSIFIRGLIFLVVLLALASHGQSNGDKEDRAAARAPAPLPSWVRASIGFAASLTVTVMLMIAISAPGASTDPSGPDLGLRGSISAD
jgi:hypothetical protein